VMVYLGVSTHGFLRTGYGATTLPALTESLTIEHNETLASHEAARLQALVDGLTTLTQS
jgi:N-acetylated-alpha-linked acidic dipeptidase